MATTYESLSVEELVDKLEEASLQGDAETVKAIASAGADVADDENKTALYTAAENGNESAVKALIEAGADVNKEDDEGSPPLLFALLDSEDSLWTGPGEDPGLDDSETIFKALIKAGADVTKPILMQTAKKFDKKKAIEIMVAAGATGPEKEE